MKNYQESASGEDNSLDNEQNNLRSYPESRRSNLPRWFSNSNIQKVSLLFLVLNFALVAYLSKSIISLSTTSENQTSKLTELAITQTQLTASVQNVENIIGVSSEKQIQLLRETTAAILTPATPRAGTSVVPSTSNIVSDPSCPARDLYTVAAKYGTDKVTTHAYDRLYQKYFGPVRCQPFRLLEIGLGCDMSYGPGASYYLWLDYFPNAEIYFIEYDEKCARAWEHANERVRVYAGDQANVTFLQEVLTLSGGNFDYIIDDGGHFMNQQVVSLEFLLTNGLKPGGMYFIEDLLSIWVPSRDGGELHSNTTLNYIKDMLSDFMSRRAKVADIIKPLSNLVTIIECMDELCAFTKKKDL